MCLGKELGMKGAFVRELETGFGSVPSLVVLLKTDPDRGIEARKKAENDRRDFFNESFIPFASGAA